LPLASGVGNLTNRWSARAAQLQRQTSVKRRTSVVVLALLLVSVAGAAEPKYPGFDVSDHDDPKVAFSFSAGDATSTSPIVITVPGRKLTNEDRKHRVDLQKHWISLHKPEGTVLVSRTLNRCGLKRDGEYPFCDVYTFEDANTKKRHEFYIYVGNWP
jgi:hypothetical protein